MMRLNRIVIVMSLMLFASGGEVAFAQPSPQQAVIAVHGAAGRLCTLAAPSVDIGGASNVGTVSGSTVVIAALSDDQTLSTKAADFDVNFAAMCNFDHRVTISSDRGGLWLAGGGVPPPGFADAVPYRATVDWAGDSTVLAADAASETEIDTPLDVNAPAHGDLTLHFHIDQGATNAGAGAPLVAGTYDDVLRVTLGPQ